MGQDKSKWSKEAHERHAKRINQNSEDRVDYTKTQKIRIAKMEDDFPRY